ncbi:MAG: acetate/propionate family kinase [Thermoguttaceae bacterium]|jgi:acetate kinase|nr:acetate/propionate family kinase [Thermoguttaceae bacterium]
MKILVANLGSTSFKYSLYDMDDERLMARGRVERIGEESSPCQIVIGDFKKEEDVSAPDHGVAVRECLRQLADPTTGCIKSASEIAGVGFKAVFAKGYSGVQFVTEDLLEAMEEFNAVLPAHNPPYVRAMRMLRKALPEIPLVAAFETGFHENIPNRNRYYGVPFEWAEQYGVRRYGFHGASHRYIATRFREIFGEDKRIVSCHLGGSSSVCAIADGQSRASSMGGSPQTGLMNNNRCGDFDPFWCNYLIKKLNISFDELLKILATKSGLLGVSGISGDVRDIAEARDSGSERAKLALEVFVGDVRRYIGASLVELGGADVLSFTGGIGEYRFDVREMILSGLEDLGIVMDPDANAKTLGTEAKISAPNSRVQIWVTPTNEEIIVGRQTKALLEKR